MSAGDLDVRRARPEDVDAIARVERAAFGRVEGARRIRGSRGDRPGVEAWVAVPRGGSPVAFVTGCAVLDEVEVHDVAVDPAWRRRGIATALMRSFLAHARSSGSRRAVLEVGSSNSAAKRLYRSLGFTPCGRRPAYYSSGTEDAEILEKKLV